MPRDDQLQQRSFIPNTFKKKPPVNINNATLHCISGFVAQERRRADNSIHESRYTSEPRRKNIHDLFGVKTSAALVAPSITCQKVNKENPVYDFLYFLLALCRKFETGKLWDLAGPKCTSVAKT